MPVSFTIFQERGFVLARFAGYILCADCISSAEAYARHPAANPLQNQLIDLSGVTGYERDFVKIISMMAKLPEHLLQVGTEPIIVYIAPHRTAQEITTLVLKSMSGVQGPVVRVVTDEEQALEILGQPERQLAALGSGAA